MRKVVGSVEVYKRQLSESHCEDALEILKEIVDADASLHMWFDRGLDFGHGSLVDAQLGNLPLLYSDYEAIAFVRLYLNATCADKIRWLQPKLANSLSLTKHYVQINTQQH